MDFDGRGMTLRWNDADGRLELLEIAHGDVMTIKHPGHFSPTGAAPPRRRKAACARHGLASGSSASLRCSRPATRRPSRRSFATPPSRCPSRTERAVQVRPRAEAPVVYLASFHDQVVITQPSPSGDGNQLKMTGDRMDVYFLMKQTTSAATTQPATNPAPAPKPAAPASASAPRAPCRTGATQPAVPAATQPAEEPVYVHWSGILRMTPVKSEPPVARAGRFGCLAGRGAGDRPSRRSQSADAGHPLRLAALPDGRRESPAEQVRCVSAGADHRRPRPQVQGAAGHAHRFQRLGAVRPGRADGVAHRARPGRGAHRIRSEGPAPAPPGRLDQAGAVRPDPTRGQRAADNPRRALLRQRGRAIPSSPSKARSSTCCSTRA